MVDEDAVEADEEGSQCKDYIPNPEELDDEEADQLENQYQIDGFVVADSIIIEDN
jgi:hypothetical protein